MSITRRSAAISEAMTAHQPSITKHQYEELQTPRSQKAKAVYFTPRIYDITNSEDLDPVEELQAGKKYLLAITCDSHRSSISRGLRQVKCSITDNFSLYLSYNYDVSIACPITPAKETFTFDAIFADEFKYEFTLPSDLPKCQLSLKLTLKTPQRSLPVVIANYTLPVHGQEKTLELDVFNIGQINQRLPEKTAILLVETARQQAIHKQQIRLRGWSEAGQQLDDIMMMTTIVSVEELQEYRKRYEEKAINPEEILKRLTQFSRNNSRKLLCWLNKLSIDNQEPFNLIIVDLTDREIPWELLELNSGLYLGVSARVVRWLPTQYFTKQRDLVIRPTSHTGSVISYLDEHLGPGWIQDEQNALQILAGKSYPSLSTLKKRLEDSLERVGLIYIGCHGSQGQHLLQQDVPELSSIMLEGIYECTPTLLTVFLNACESARTIKKTPDDNSNFVDTFLAYCASGFIGTLAQVDIRTASTIAGQFLLSALQTDGVWIAEKLRTLRSIEVEQLKQKMQDESIVKTDTDFYRVIDTFMYVYYGNPLARLRLSRREEFKK